MQERLRISKVRDANNANGPVKRTNKSRQHCSGSGKDDLGSLKLHWIQRINESRHATYAAGERAQRHGTITTVVQSSRTDTHARDAHDRAGLEVRNEICAIVGHTRSAHATRTVRQRPELEIRISFFAKVSSWGMIYRAGPSLQDCGSDVPPRSRRSRPAPQKKRQEENKVGRWYCKRVGQTQGSSGGGGASKRYVRTVPGTDFVFFVTRKVSFMTNYSW